MSRQHRTPRATGDSRATPSSANAPDPEGSGSVAELADGRLSTGRSIALLCIVVALSLLPFVNKAFHIDDPLFLWSARQILSEPLDFYGFDVNWYGYETPASVTVKNPPGCSYFIAVAAGIAGWSEVALHLAFLLPALGVVLGTYALGRELGARSVLAALLALWTPVFMISATQVMSDVPMLCLWIWATWLWLVGLRKENGALLAGAAALVTACALTKYFGICLLPLLFVYALHRKRALGWWAAWLLIPAAALAGYQFYTASVYGRGLLWDAGEYATSFRGFSDGPLAVRTLTGLAFTGGCMAPLALFAYWLAPRRTLAIGGVVVLVVFVLLLLGGSIGELSLRGEDGTDLVAALQLAFFSVLGLAWITVAILDVVSRRDAISLLLALWLVGTFLFATYVNWSINGRSILPMVPAAALLVARRLESVRLRTRVWCLLLAGAAVVSLAPAWGDYRLAGSARRAAQRIAGGRLDTGGALFFQGHWGFQYYMEQRGAKPLDIRNVELKPGDRVVSPHGNTNVQILPGEILGEPTFITEEPSRWITTMSAPLGAGFYSDLWGPLPFALGRVPDEGYEISPVVRTVGSAPR